MQKKQMIISPSIASANQLCLEKEVKRIEHSYQDLHIDIEDGNFIPNITFGMKTIKSLRSITSLPFSFHLMVNDPYRYLEDIFSLNPSIIFIHVESVDYMSDIIQRVRRKGIKCGIAFNPSTLVNQYKYLLNNVDGVLIMTAEPDGKGQMFIPEMAEKINTVRSFNQKTDIWVDGAITYDKLDSLKAIGVSHAVMGRQIFGK
ncbi:ribulose-phosphate 3-epimerase [Cytobacillus firmus]|uniref:Ribulose-phosphate 3-epimerase n=1 Tax=Cytobacillus firmus DS1 TaxID=1307436 RepID=W7L4C4_CYTFI|nr:ribulose-phosphate 3-epimerase [Cytobacillus firmus]EWG10012.1 ribulose-phosphate 3-epimerase [Cytobacillus firmus DS1]